MTKSLLRFVLQCHLPLSQEADCRGHSLPPIYPEAVVSVLSSNVTKDTTNVQLRCSSCTTWSGGGKLDIQSTSGNFIYAYGNQQPATPDVPTSSFTQHLDHGNFNLNLKAAQVNANTAPTITGAAKSSGSSGGLFGLSQRQLVPPERCRC